jgi:hypothetical protein
MVTSHMDYSALESLGRDEFERRMVAFDKSSATKSDTADIAKIEDLLLVRRGTLAGQDFYVSRALTAAGRAITFYDLIVSSLLEGHSRSFVLHTLLGTKFFVQPRRKITLAEDSSIHVLDYCTSGYGCC